MTRGNSQLSSTSLNPSLGPRSGGGFGRSNAQGLLELRHACREFFVFGPRFGRHRLHVIEFFAWDEIKFRDEALEARLNYGFHLGFEGLGRAGCIGKQPGHAVQNAVIGLHICVLVWGMPLGRGRYKPASFTIVNALGARPAGVQLDSGISHARAKRVSSRVGP